MSPKRAKKTKGHDGNQLSQVKAKLRQLSHPEVDAKGDQGDAPAGGCAAEPLQGSHWFGRSKANTPDQVDYAILKRRLTNSTVSATAVDRRSNSAIRHALWKHTPDLELRTAEVSLCRGDALLVWQALQMKLPEFRLVREVDPLAELGLRSEVNWNKLPTQFPPLVRMTPRLSAAYRSGGQGLQKPGEDTSAALSQQWMMVPPQQILKAEAVARLDPAEFLVDAHLSQVPGQTRLYCVSSPQPAVTWFARMEEAARRPGNIVILQLPVASESGAQDGSDVPPALQATGIASIQTGSPRELRVVE